MFKLSPPSSIEMVTLALHNKNLLNSTAALNSTSETYKSTFSTFLIHLELEILGTLHDVFLFAQQFTGWLNEMAELLTNSLV